MHGVALQSILRPSVPRPTFSSIYFFFFNDTPTTEIYTLSLHDALPICRAQRPPRGDPAEDALGLRTWRGRPGQPQQNTGAVDSDRKSTRLNSSHVAISYAVFCLKKKKKKKKKYDEIRANRTVGRTHDVT